MDHQDWEPVILRKPVTVTHKPKPKPKGANYLETVSYTHLTLPTKA